MPTVLRVGPYRLYFYSHEPNEPPHIQIDRDKFAHVQDMDKSKI